MSWREEMKAAMLREIAAGGGLVREGDGGWRYGGWQDFTQEGGEYLTTTLSAHVAECGADVSKSTYTESEWTEFDGTFAEPPWGDHTGTDATIHCNCGKVAGRTWRYTGSIAALIEAITR
jgi:hypothetical protein